MSRPPNALSARGRSRRVRAPAFCWLAFVVGGLVPLASGCDDDSVACARAQDCASGVCYEGRCIPWLSDADVEGDPDEGSDAATDGDAAAEAADVPADGGPESAADGDGDDSDEHEG